ncbi:hypothetical protein GCM10027031_00940 [Corynebacterium atrinae]
MLSRGRPHSEQLGRSWGGGGPSRSICSVFWAWDSERILALRLAIRWDTVCSHRRSLAANGPSPSDSAQDPSSNKKYFRLVSGSIT